MSVSTTPPPTNPTMPSIPIAPANQQAWYAIPTSWLSSGPGTRPSLEHRIQHDLFLSYFKDGPIINGTRSPYSRLDAASYLATWAHYNCSSNDAGLLQPIRLPAGTIIVPELLAIGALGQKEGVQKIRGLCGGGIGDEVVEKIWMHLEVVREVAFWLAAIKEQFPVIEEEEEEEGPVQRYPPKPKKYGAPPGGKLTFPKSGHGTLAKYRSWYGETPTEAEASNEGSERRGADGKFAVCDFEVSWETRMVYEIMTEGLTEEDIEYM